MRHPDPDKKRKCLAPARSCLIIGLSLCLNSCSVAPKPGELKDAERNRAEISDLINRRAVRADAKAVFLRRDALSGWSVTHVALAPELFEEKLSTDKNRSYDHPYVYVHARDVDWQCRYAVDVPVYVRNDPKSKESTQRQFLNFGRGDCYELEAAQKRFTAYLSLFNLEIDLSTELTRPRLLRNVDDALRIMELKFYKALHNRTLEKEDWEAHDVTVAERSGYYERSVTFIHAELYAVPAERYYRVLLTGKHTIAYLMITGPISASLDELQAHALRILRAVAYETR
jgi:hypothetical protein